MAHLQYHCYPGFGEAKREELWYSQAVRVGDYIEIAGQGGWDPETSKIPLNPDEEIDQAFANVDYNLKHAGGKGWAQVYKIRLYLIDISETSVGAAVRNFKKWLPNHRPILTCIGVNQLGLPGMRVEIEVIAHDKEGAEAAAAKGAA
ncbi:Endoribonuclease L-PSP/chorismate mutase-like protein [Paraphoma chrysanthemicola]|uniref:Endoribonuclease L-PSP/chorismate mutase-like protein n=1 Tax=Paraphoma chrysanthemicola TaxID=798071 RepID=A0A8K0VVQ5_9PLEO|nr:Endoribonuclease L-PSP/chorismate mutase-like protein [Paraphoma chrysanthemicola]